MILNDPMIKEKKITEALRNRPHAEVVRCFFLLSLPTVTSKPLKALELCNLS